MIGMKFPKVIEEKKGFYESTVKYQLVEMTDEELFKELEKGYLEEHYYNESNEGMTGEEFIEDMRKLMNKGYIKLE